MQRFCRYFLYSIQFKIHVCCWQNTGVNWYTEKLREQENYNLMESRLRCGLCYFLCGQWYFTVWIGKCNSYTYGTGNFKSQFTSVRYLKSISVLLILASHHRCLDRLHGLWSCSTVFLFEFSFRYPFQFDSCDSKEVARRFVWDFFPSLPLPSPFPSLVSRPFFPFLSLPGFP